MIATRSGRALAAGALWLALAGAAAAQAPLRVRGTIEQVDGATLSVKAADGSLLRLVLADNAVVLAIEKRSLADIKPGVFLGTAAVSQGDGILRALEVHIFPEAMRGTGEGHRPWERPGASMTNATVADTVTGVSGNIVTLRYKGGEQKVMVAPDTPIVGYAPGDRSELKPGKMIVVPGAMKQEDGSLRAPRVSVERTAVPPI